MVVIAESGKKLSASEAFLENQLKTRMINEVKRP